VDFCLQVFARRGATGLEPVTSGVTGVRCGSRVVAGGRRAERIARFRRSVGVVASLPVATAVFRALSPAIVANRRHSLPARAHRVTITRRSPRWPPRSCRFLDRALLHWRTNCDPLHQAPPGGLVPRRREDRPPPPTQAGSPSRVAFPCRCSTTSSPAARTPECDVTAATKSLRSIAYSCESATAVTVAVRGTSRIKAISPK
jgi:hypothetical protein